jgi:hypothetical protein
VPQKLLFVLELQIKDVVNLASHEFFERRPSLPVEE